MIQYAQELNNSKIYNKDDKTNYVDYLDDLSWEEKVQEKSRDTSAVNLTYRVFLLLEKFELELNKGIEDFNEEEMLSMFKELDILERRRTYYVLNGYFNFIEHEVGVDILNNIDIIKINEKPKELLTFKEFKDLVITILDDYDNENKYYEAALVILYYYGIDTIGLIDFTYDDLFDNDILYGKVDECFLPYLMKASKVNYFTRGNNDGSTRRVKLSGNPNVICKPKNIKHHEQLRDNYYRTLKRVLLRYEDYKKLTVKRLKMSGGIHFFVKECINKELEVNIDWLYSRNNNGLIYEKIASKYNLNYKTLKPYPDKMQYVIKEYEEQMNK